MTHTAFDIYLYSQFGVIYQFYINQQEQVNARTGQQEQGTMAGPYLATDIFTTQTYAQALARVTSKAVAPFMGVIDNTVSLDGNSSAENAHAWMLGVNNGNAVPQAWYRDPDTHKTYFFRPVDSSADPAVATAWDWLEDYDDQGYTEEEINAFIDAKITAYDEALVFDADRASDIIGAQRANIANLFTDSANIGIVYDADAETYTLDLTGAFNTANAQKTWVNTAISQAIAGLDPKDADLGTVREFVNSSTNLGLLADNSRYLFIDDVADPSAPDGSGFIDNRIYELSSGVWETYDDANGNEIIPIIGNTVINSSEKVQYLMIQDADTGVNIWEAVNLSVTELATARQLLADYTNGVLATVTQLTDLRTQLEARYDTITVTTHPQDVLTVSSIHNRLRMLVDAGGRAQYIFWFPGAAGTKDWKQVA